MYKYLDLLKRFTPSTLSQDHLVFLQDLEHVGSENPRSQSEWIDQLSQSDEPKRRDRASLIRKAELAAESFRTAEDNGVRIWSGPSADKEEPAQRIYPQPDISHLEKDFTTPGTPSKLGCPFAARSRRQSSLATPRSSTSRMSQRGRRSKRPSFTDPIRAEICGNDMVSASASIDGSAPVCPIRFLDQHAPEEVAKYFENHKHEIPRSHEVCIKRFQSNAESIELLDRKYGNLVSMIQGLGQKHQEFLPAEPEEDDEAPDGEGKTEKRVENWAEAVSAAVSASLEHFTPEKEESAENEFDEENVLDEARTAHFDRPMKEIRVGESPSRPWGIQIPTKYTDMGESSSSVGSAPTASPPLPLETNRPMEETPQKPSKCPFDHRALGKTPQKKRKIDDPKPEPLPQPLPEPMPQPRRALSPEPAPRAEQPKQEEDLAPKMIPQMVFNGPVFLGYPPDQLMALLQSGALGGMVR